MGIRAVVFVCYTNALIDHNPLPSDDQFGRELAWRQPWTLLCDYLVG